MQRIHWKIKIQKWKKKRKSGKEAAENAHVGCEKGSGSVRRIKGRRSISSVRRQLSRVRLGAALTSLLKTESNWRRRWHAIYPCSMNALAPALNTARYWPHCDSAGARHPRHQGCRGDGISIPILIPYPQESLLESPWESPYPRNLK